MFLESTIPDSYGREQKVYLMNRDGLSLLAMSFTGKTALEWKLKYIKAFNEMEKQLREYNELPSYQISNPVDRAKKWIEEEKIRISLAKTIKQQKPKVEFANAITSSPDSIIVRELAKILVQNGISIGEKRLFSWLRENGYLIKAKDCDYNAPTQKSMNLKLFEYHEEAVVSTSGTVAIRRTPRVTTKGQRYFVDKFLHMKKPFRTVK